MRTTLVALLVTLTCFTALCADEIAKQVAIILMEEEAAPEEVSGLIEEPPVLQLMHPEEYMIADKYHPQGYVGNIPLWLVYNAAVPDGWSWTGYSSLKLDDQFRPSRWKFGMISGELELERPIHETRLQYRHDDTDVGMREGTTVGIYWMKEF